MDLNLSNQSSDGPFEQEQGFHLSNTQCLGQEAVERLMSTTTNHYQEPTKIQGTRACVSMQHICKVCDT